MAALEVFTNDATTTVTSGGTSAPTAGTVETWTVQSSASFPSLHAGATQFHVADPGHPTETVAVTAVSGTTWTVTRGAESTTPVAHTAGFTVAQVVTAGTLKTFQYQPWQFPVEASGAKGDGAFLYDAHMTGSSAVLTTAGLPAPSAPTVANSSSGGTVAAGTYQVKVTYVNQFGETLASTASSTTTTGSTSTITVTSPLPWTNATAYYVYCTQAGGSSFTRQQTAGSPTPLRTSYVISAPPSSGGANTPGANTSNSAPFTSADVGKAIIVPSAGGFTNVPLVTTIASFQSSTQVTLTAASTSAVTGYGAVYGTDDTSAIQAAINAAVTFAQGSEGGTGEVVFSDKIYCVAGALAGTYQNSQLQIPYVDPYTGPKVNLKLTGPQEATGPVHWEQPNPPADGCTLASIYYSDSGSPPTPTPSVIGGPVENSAAGVFFGGDVGLFSNMRVIVDGINVLAAYRPSICGLDLYGVAQADIRSFSYFGMARTATAAGGWPAYAGGAANPAPWQVFGYRCPYTGNNAQNDVTKLTVYGPWYGFLFTDHFTAQSITCIYAKAAAVSVSASGSHHAYISALTSEVTDYPVYCPVDGTYGGPATQALTISSLQSENAVTVIEDTGNHLYGDVHAENASLTGGFSGGKSGAANVRLIWDFQPLGVVGTPPAVPLNNTAFTNDFWRDAVVIITSGGAAVTAIAIDGQATGLTLSTSGSVTVPVRNGGTITLTYASTAPTWQWVLA